MNIGSHGFISSPTGRKAWPNAQLFINRTEFTFLEVLFSYLKLGVFSVGFFKTANHPVVILALKVSISVYLVQHSQKLGIFSTRLKILNCTKETSQHSTKVLIYLKMAICQKKRKLVDCSNKGIINL